MTETSGRDNVISVAARAIAEGRDQPVMVHSSALAQCAISAIEQAGFAITPIDGESVDDEALFEAFYEGFKIRGNLYEDCDTVAKTLFLEWRAAAERNEETG